MKQIFWFIEDLGWNIRCYYNFWLHGPYGLAKVIEKMPFRFIVKYLRKYGARIGKDCRFERGLNIHRPLGQKPFENLHIGNNVYLGHNVLLDLSKKIIVKDKVAIGGRSQIWTHTGYYKDKDFHQPNYIEVTGDVIIDQCVIIYSNVIIAQGLTIGEFSRIAAGSVVTNSIGEYTFAGGIPAKTINQIK